MDDIITVRCDRNSDISATVARIEALSTTYFENAHPRAGVGSADTSCEESKNAREDSADAARELWLLIDNGRMLKLADVHLTVGIERRGAPASNR